MPDSIYTILKCNHFAGFCNTCSTLLIAKFYLHLPCIDIKSGSLHAFIIFVINKHTYLHKPTSSSLFVGFFFVVSFLFSS
ncbi:hypothetical protein BDF20DRAFT_867904 [Mycotypha africana]|uniref:uncharacterized protein n=1 Tax=Mycotypha africana TaxID=64632 RepID=UPI0023012B15|nr:uncharacterized protein BDF20DRAFT_867904 [Mycotypha africana]KAI8979149.1 hypothetical protein BDF20DRAFT_867904 [Mycotypha africana]